MGDEVRRTQRGNNNAYCLDDETTWFDWSGLERHADVHRFVRTLIAIRAGRGLPIEHFQMTLQEMLRHRPVTWHGVRLNEPDRGHASHTLAATIRLPDGPSQLHLIVNAYWEPLTFEIPPPEHDGAGWRRIVDTSRDAPDDVRAWAEAAQVPDATCLVAARSVVVLLTMPAKTEP